MRAKLRTAVIAVGSAALAVFVLMIASVLTGSQALALTAAAFGAFGVIGAVFLVLKAMERFVGAGDRTSTRVSNLEKRLASARDGATENERVLSDLRTELDSANAESAEVESARSQQLLQIEKELDTLSRTVRVLRRRVPEGYLEPVRAELSELSTAVRQDLDALDARLRNGLEQTSARTQDAWVLSAETALGQGRRPRSFLTVGQAATLFEHYLEREQLLELGPLITNYALLSRLDLGTLRKLYRFYKAAGYWDLASLALKSVAEKSQRNGDRKALTKLARETLVFSRPWNVRVDLPSAHAYDASGPIVHMVGRTLPDTQSGFTLRTHYTARAQSRAGLPVVVVGQSGTASEDVEELRRYEHEGVGYVQLPGPQRSSMLLDEWIEHNILQLAELVRTLRPSVLHAHSDFLNALIVSAVGKAYGIPTAYETRGFWEESLLTRIIATNRWTHDADVLFARYGHPSAYTLRKGAEEFARTLPDHNFTLAEVMKDHILESSGGALDEEQVTVVPNAVNPDEFPIQDRDPVLAAQLGISEDAVTVGYISSMVEYESIETLIDGFRMAATRVSTPLYLLLVGGGNHLQALKDHAKKVGDENIIFTGAVPHDDVLRYYGMIDIFVVPRRKTSVADLVTPLKPFEAFATGRAVVLSDVEALKEIAEQSGAAKTFRAGYSRELGRALIALINDPQQRRDLGARAARWVRGERTWDKNVVHYYRVYRDLGYRGRPGSALYAELRRFQQTAAPQTAIEPGREGVRSSSSRHDAPDSEDGPRSVSQAMVTSGARDIAPTSSSTPTALPGSGRRAVVVAMKPQIAGRIRRNIMTLLELGFEVTVVNSKPRDDFFQGLSHPHLTADFIEVRSLAVRYQARMTRKKTERKARSEQQKKARALKAREPLREAPEWMSGDILGAQLIHQGWTSETGKEVRRKVGEIWTDVDKRFTKFRNTTRTKRDLTIRDQLKQVHLVNRFVEFWRLAPERIADHQPDLIVSSDLPGLVGASIAAERLGVPHLHDCHELYLESTTLRPAERRVLWPVEKAYLKRADSVVIVNETIRDEYEKRYGVRGTVLRNAAPAVKEEVRTNPMNLHALAGISQDAKIVLYQGGLAPGRGLDICVRSAVHFPEGAHLIFIGKGKSHEELTALAVELGVTDRVHFLPAVDPGDLPAYTAGAHVGVIPYQPVSRNNEYALPNKAFEYPGAGIPFVAADLRELRRIAETARCGEVYDPFDPEQLAEAVCLVLDPEHYPTYRRNAEAFGRANTWESEREILVGEIQRLTSGGSAE